MKRGNRETAEIIRDPIHGFVELQSHELELIDSEPFRRLRRIKQLGLTSFVWPGAEHSRFGHSLGVMEFASQAFDSLVRKGLHKKLKWKRVDVKKWRRTLRAAALLHDLGHAPFSHGTEDLLPMGYTHAKFTAEVVRQDPVKTILQRAEIEPDEVNDIITGEAIKVPQILTQLLAGDFDVDRMDYLLRDSLFTGVPYGNFDHQRLVRCLTWYRDRQLEGQPVLALEIGGIHAAEGLMIARYFMFCQVYFNKVRRAYDLLLKEAMIKILSGSGGRYPSNISEFLLWDDLVAWGKIVAAAKRPDGQEAAHRLVDRNHYKRVWETRPMPDGREVQRFDTGVRRLCDDYGEQTVLIDKAEQAPHKFETVAFRVKELDGRYVRINDLKNPPSKLIANLQPISQRRIYTRDEGLLDKMKDFCKKYMRTN